MIPCAPGAPPPDSTAVTTSVRLPREVRQALLATGVLFCIVGVFTLIHDWVENPGNAKGTFLALNGLGVAQLVGALRRPRASRRRLAFHGLVQAAILLMWSSLVFEESDRRSIYVLLWIIFGFLALRAVISLLKAWDEPERETLVAHARRDGHAVWNGGEISRLRCCGASRSIRIHPVGPALVFAYITWTNYRTASIGDAMATEAVIVLATAAFYASRWLRQRQDMILGEGVVVLHAWNLRPVPLRADAIAGVVLERVLWGGLQPALLLAVDAHSTCLARVWGSEWDTSLLTAALEPLGIAVIEDDAAPKRPREIEASHPGAMRPLELHPLVGSLVIPATVLFLAAVVRAAVGAVTGR